MSEDANQEDKCDNPHCPNLFISHGDFVRKSAVAQIVYYIMEIQDLRKEVERLKKLVQEGGFCE